MLKVTYIYRKQSPRYFSIETVFHTIQSVLGDLGVEISEHSVSRSGASLSAIFSNMQYARKLRADVLHITGDVHYVSLVTKGPVVLTVHDIGSALKGGRIKRFIIGMLWFWLPALCVQRITVISEFSARELLKVVPFARKKIRVIQNPLTLSCTYYPLEFHSECPVVLVVGTKENKNLDRIARALIGVNCQLLIIGHLSEPQVQLLKECGLRYRNMFDVPSDQMQDVYRQCDILCFASTYEGFGLPIIEAQAAGRPVITSTVASMPEVAGDGALFVDPYRTYEIREAVLRLIGDEPLRNSLIEKGLNNVKRFMPENIARQYLLLYQEVAK